MINLFCGYDPREAVGFHVFVASVLSKVSVPVSIIPLASNGLPTGSNNFTLSRFLVPYLMGYKDHAIFADASDMLALDDIAYLDAMFDPAYAVQVVKRADYESMHHRKYIGTPLECNQSNYHRKNWASLMIINCEHPSWRWVNPESIANTSPLYLLQLTFCGDSIGELPPRWNVLADECDDIDQAAILHWTAGIPAIPHYAESPGAEAWFNHASDMLRI
jgi:hypothetical protein